MLLKDRELVCSQKMLVKLPAAVPVSKIFTDYVQYQVHPKSQGKIIGPSLGLANWSQSGAC